MKTVNIPGTRLKIDGALGSLEPLSCGAGVERQQLACVLGLLIIQSRAGNGLDLGGK